MFFFRPPRVEDHPCPFGLKPFCYFQIRAMPSSKFNVHAQDSPQGATESAVRTLAIIGGGLAGIAAAEVASRQGIRVTLFERARVLGGRAASLLEPDTGQWIDNGQHVTMGCCVELLELHRRLGLDSHFKRVDSVPFLQKDGRRWDLAPTSFLPKSFQLLPSLLTIPFLSWRDRIASVLLLRSLARPAKADEVDLPLLHWLRQRKASQAAMDALWSPLVHSALSETLENASVSAVRKVVCDGFMAGKDALALYLPTEPLRTIYGTRAAAALEKRGVAVRPLTRIRRFYREPLEETDAHAAPRIESLEYSGGGQSVGGDRESFDAYILAVPAYRVWEILTASEMQPYLDQLDLNHFEPGAITSVHLWLQSRLLPENDHYAAMLGGPGQFLFCPPREKTGTETPEHGIYHTVVISASHRLLSEEELSARGGDALIRRVMEQLGTVFPEAFSRETNRLLHARVTTFFDAVFSPSPIVYRNRPCQKTPFSNFALAGDWTDTQWPATLEGAVRSAHRAVEAVCGAACGD